MEAAAVSNDFLRDKQQLKEWSPVQVSNVVASIF
jgi:hypothetical protein